MKKFLIHSFIFLLPFGLLLGLPLVIFWRAGELVPISKVIDRQTQAPLVLFGRVYTDSRHDQEYKVQSTLTKAPEVLFMGTSRVLGYRSVFFKKPEVFYNAGRSIARVKDLNIFLKKIPENQTPKVILVSLDQDFFFNEWQPDPTYTAEQSTLELFFKYNWRMLYKDYFNKKFTLRQIFHPTGVPAIGLNAVVRQNGFRNDGSYLYGDLINDPVAISKSHELKQNIVAKLTPKICLKNFYGSTILPDSLSELEKFLLESKARGITVIGFISPYSGSVYSKIQSFNDECSHAVLALNSEVKKVFAKTGVSFFDAQELNKFGAKDEEFFDAGHYSEKLALRIFLAMGKLNPVLQKYVDLKDLQTHLDNSNSDFVAFPQP